MSTKLSDWLSEGPADLNLTEMTATFVYCWVAFTEDMTCQYSWADFSNLVFLIYSFLLKDFPKRILNPSLMPFLHTIKFNPLFPGDMGSHGAPWEPVGRWCWYWTKLHSTNSAPLFCPLLYPNPTNPAMWRTRRAAGWELFSSPHGCFQTTWPTRKKTTFSLITDGGSETWKLGHIFIWYWNIMSISYFGKESKKYLERV